MKDLHALRRIGRARQGLAFLLIFLLLFPFTLISFGDGDLNVGGGGGGVSPADGDDKWQTVFIGCKITVVDIRNPHDNYTTPINLFTGDYYSGQRFFGNNSKLDYVYHGASLNEGGIAGAYYNTPLPAMMYDQDSVMGAYNINTIQTFFTEDGFLDYLAPKFGMTRTQLSSGLYTLVIEPLANIMYNGQSYIGTATDFILQQGTSTPTILTTVIYRNLPFGMYLENDDTVLGFNANTQDPSVTLSRNETNRDLIFRQLGLGIISFPMTYGTLTVVKTNDKNGQYDGYDLNNKPGGLVNNDTINGAVFRLQSNGNDVFGNQSNFTFTINGSITFNEVSMGAYTLQEITAPTGYLLNSTVHNINITTGASVTIGAIGTSETVNKEPTGRLTIRKHDGETAANPMTPNTAFNGARYGVYASGNITNKANTTTLYTNNQLVVEKTLLNGEAVVEGLPMGSYYIKEIQAPNGYLLSPTSYAVSFTYANQNTAVINRTVTVIDVEPTGRLTIRKHDIETGATPQGEAVFLNAVYGLYADEDIWNKAHTIRKYTNGQLVTTRALNASGEALITNLPMGKYYTKEITPPIGYLLSPTSTAITIAYINQNTPVITVEAINSELVKKRRVHIYKTGINQQSGMTTGISGASFAIKEYLKVQLALTTSYQGIYFTYAEIWAGIDEDGNPVSVDPLRVLAAQAIAPTVDIATTDYHGDAYFDLLPYARYLGKEIITPIDFETASDFLFNVDKDETEIVEIEKKVIQIHLNDEQLETYLQLKKLDERSKQLISLDNASFIIYARTDIEDRGNPGNYYFRAGELIRQKIGSIWYSIFTTNADGTINPSYGEWHSDLETTGTAVLPLTLPVGEYEIDEIKTPNGFLKNSSRISFDVKNIRDYSTDADGDPVQTVEIVNTQPTGKLFIDKRVNLRQKIDGVEAVSIPTYSYFDTSITNWLAPRNTQPKTTSISLNNIVGYSSVDHSLIEDEELAKSGNYFQVFAKNDIIDMTTGDVYYTDGNYYGYTDLGYDMQTGITTKAIVESDPLAYANYYPLTDGALIGTYQTNMSGRAGNLEVSGLPMGEYMVKETGAYTGLVLDDSEYLFNFEMLDDTTKEYKETIKVLNNTTALSILKKSSVNDKPISQASLAISKVIRDEDGEIITDTGLDSVLISWSSIERGYIIEGLEAGAEYRLDELSPPTYYLTAESIYFTVENTADLQEIVMIDDPQLTELSITKKSTSKSAKPSETINYELAVDNLTSTPLFLVNITDTLQDKQAEIVKNSIFVYHIQNDILPTDEAIQSTDEAITSPAILDITNVCKITATATDFKIATFTDLYSPNQLLVKYKVRIHKDFKGVKLNNIATTSAKNAIDPYDTHELRIDKPSKKATIAPMAQDPPPPVLTLTGDEYSLIRRFIVLGLLTACLIYQFMILRKEEQLD